MLEINSPKVDKSLLENEIEEIINNYKKNPQKRKRIEKKKFKQERKSIYQIEDFTQYHDVEFIENIYRVVLQREVDPEGLQQRLHLLKTGQRSKTEILAGIRFSKEGRKNGITILGIKKRYLMSILYRIPMVSFVIKVLMLPRLIERINRFEAHYFMAEKEQDIRINERIDTLQNNLSHLESATHHKIEQFKEEIIEIQTAKESLRKIEKNITTLINQLKNNSSELNILEKLEGEKKHFLDQLYISFENKFRGSREDIKNRQSYYLPRVQNILNNIKGTIVDIGCGRGEWLELLKENQLEALGIDLNRLMVQESQKRGLDAQFQDALSYLESKEDNSIAVITGFHIVEHLPFEVLVALFDESLRTLKKGGMVIFETPNPENIMVGSCTFYTDPTHINPIPPATLQFIAQQRGFINVEIERLHPRRSPSFIEIENSHDINELISASTKEQDYAIIGYKK